MKDLYQILGVKTSASADEIKKAYRDAAKKYHPDRTGGDKAKESRFKEMSAAYEVLSDPKKRAQYDAMRRGEFEGVPHGAGAAGMPNMGGLEEILAQMFGGGGFPGAGAGGGARRVIFEEVPLGGAGGRARGRSRARARVFEDGDPFDFGGGGGPAGPAPHLEQVVRTPDGAEFTRKGADLFIDVPLSVEEAVLGAKVDVPTLTGRVTLTIPAGTSSGKKLRLRGKGWEPGGDLYAVVQIVVPDRVDDEARKALSEFSRRAPVRPRR